MQLQKLIEEILMVGRKQVLNNLLKNTFEIIADPITKNSLRLDNSKTENEHVISGNLVEQSEKKYNIEFGIADLLPKKEDMVIEKSKFDVWEKVQENGLLTYEKFPEFNCSIEGRNETELFKDFCSFSGIVLDVGSGPSIPGYFLNNQKIDLAIGLDPLIPHKEIELKSNIDLIRGIGEFMPFNNNIFDLVCFATSFDHVIYPELVLKEVQRVLKPEGQAVFWIEEDRQDKKSLISRGINKTKRTILPKLSKKVKSRNAKIKKLQETVTNLEIPKGAEDHFHIKHFKYNEFTRLCSTLNFEYVEEEKLDNNQGVFLRYNFK